MRRRQTAQPAIERRYYVNRVRTAGGTMEWQCEAGQMDKPVGCDRHSEHYWCSTCQGYYGVPHEGDFSIHAGPNAHPPLYHSERIQCACRPCKQATGRD